jgi:hypothetical protein
VQSNPCHSGDAHLTVRAGVKEHQSCRFSERHPAWFLETGHTSAQSRIELAALKSELFPCEGDSVHRISARAANRSWNWGEENISGVRRDVRGLAAINRTSKVVSIGQAKPASHGEAL